MGAFAEMTKKDAGKWLFDDSIVIRQYNGGITGGRTLDMTDFKGTVIKSGHIVIHYLDDDDKDAYKPLGVTDGAYDSLKGGQTYVGVVVATKPANEPCVGIMDDGRVNDVAMPYPITAEQRAALKVALPNLIFEHD